MKCAAALVVLAMLIAPIACAEPEAGDAVPPVLTVAGKQVPLPVMRGDGLGSYGAIQNVVLFRIAASGALDAMAEINTNDIAVVDGWGIAADCQRRDLVLTVVRSSSGWDAACFFVTHTEWEPAEGSLSDTPTAWLQAKAFAAKRRLRLPANTVTAGFRVANRRDLMDVRFHFLVDPDAAHSTDWADSPWGRGKLQEDHRRLAFDRRIAEWSAMMIGCIEAGLKNRLHASLTVPGPGSGEAELERNSVLHQRQERLDYLRSSGLLSAEQFARESAMLRQADADDRHDAIDPGEVHFYRLLSLQGMSVTSDALVTFLWTAQSVQAAALTLLQASLRTGRSYVVGYLWDMYGGTPIRPDFARTVDFAYGGVDR
jgi:hypothetical protein